MDEFMSGIDADRIAQDALAMVNIESVTGNTVRIADHYEKLLADIGCAVTRYELYPNNPTVVAEFGDGGGTGKTVIFNGHMDVVPLVHTPARIENGRLYGRGSCDMKGSLAAIAEVIRVLKQSGKRPKGKVIVIANSLHESPGGRGEDLIALMERGEWKADAAIVMEGATTDCTIAQLGSATFEITIRRAGDPSHQLYTPPGTPHPITVAADVIQELNRLNAELAKQEVSDIGFASYFIGSVRSGGFYNQFPTTAQLVGVRRYDPAHRFADIETEFRQMLAGVAAKHRVEIALDFVKVRDGYRTDKNSTAVAALVRAVGQVRGIELPLVGKQLVTDAGIIANALQIPVLCHGPDQQTAHGETEYVEIEELGLAAKAYLSFIHEYIGLESGDGH